MMAYRIVLECGDTSSLRSKKTVEGYTHDWEVFVRGVDNAPIHHFIDKVVFNLHETFPKPKRVIKEPPYSLKESGYAGFDIPIHIYLKNKNEPKRFEIMYNLNLETTVPTVRHHSHHTEIVVNPSEEFRKKLLKGGATPTTIESSSEKSEVKTLSMVGKPKLSGNAEMKKHRMPEPKTSNQFNDLFGPPIKTAKMPQESKKPSEKSSGAKVAPAPPEKSDKVDKSTKVKHSPHKDSKKEKSSEERKEKREKEKDGVKDKEKSKDKSKRSSSPSNNKSSEKRPSSPSIKKSSSPSIVPKRPSSPSSKPKEKEIKKESEKDKDKEREKEKSKDSTKPTSDEVKSEKTEKESKSERKKDKKKHKEDRDKEKKDKHRDKERERSKDKEGVKISEKKVEKLEKVEKEKPEVKPTKEDRKSPKTIKESEKVKEEKISKPEKSEKTEKEKSKESKSEKPDKSKHKHKKKDKKEKRDGSREREKKEKREKSKSSSEHKSEVPNHTSVAPVVTARVSEVLDRDSSESSGDEEVVESRLTGNSVPKKEPAPPAPPVEVLRMSPPPAPSDRKDKSERKRDRSKSRREEKESKKRKRKSDSKGLGDDEISTAKKSKDRDQSTSPLAEPVSSSQSPIATNPDLLHSSKVKHSDEPPVSEPTTGDSEQVAPDSTNSTLVDTEEPLVFSEDYVLQLKELQQKIMTLQDNQELQRVVQVIAETGQYEITKKTFDFDLCALDRRTVQRLQQFFAS